jgi:hypothetical protein
MGANASVPEGETTPNPTTTATSLPLQHGAPPSDDSSTLTEGQKRRRFEKEAVKKGFEGPVTIDSDPREAMRHAQLEYINATHWGEKDSRMVFWAKGCTIRVELDVTSGLGITSQTSPDPDQWIWGEYHVMRDVNAQMAETLAVGLALRIAKDECEKLAKMERPSSAKDALLRIQGSDFVILSGGVGMPKVGVRMVQVGLVAAHIVRNLGIELELRWIPDGCEIDGVTEANHAAVESAKYRPPPKGPHDAFIRDVQEDYKKKRKAKLRKEELKRRKLNVGTGH